LAPNCLFFPILAPFSGILAPEREKLTKNQKYRLRYKIIAVYLHRKRYKSIDFENGK